MSRVNLTPKQRRAYDFIAAEIRATGTAPTYDQIAAALQITSKSSVCRLVDALVERGWLRRLPYRARAPSPWKARRRPPDRKSVV